MYITYDESIDAGEKEGGLAGKRLVVTDNIAIGNFGTAAACASVRHEPQRSAAVVSRLHEADARRIRHRYTTPSATHDRAIDHVLRSSLQDARRRDAFFQ